MTDIPPWRHMFTNIPHTMLVRLQKLATERGEQVGGQGFMQWIMSSQGDDQIRKELSRQHRNILLQLLENAGLCRQEAKKPMFSPAKAQKERIRRVFSALLSVELEKTAVDPTLKKMVDTPELSKEWEGMVALLAKSPALRKIAEAHAEDRSKRELPRIEVTNIPIQEARYVDIDRVFLAELAQEVFGHENTPTLGLIGVSKALSTLSVRGRDIILLRLGPKWAFSRIGKAMKSDNKPEGVKASRAHSGFEEAMNHMRHASNTAEMLGRNTY